MDGSSTTLEIRETADDLETGDSHTSLLYILLLCLGLVTLSLIIVARLPDNYFDQDHHARGTARGRENEEEDEHVRP